MAQPNDYVVDNDTGSAVRTDFTFSKANNSLLSIYTNLLNPDIS